MKKLIYTLIALTVVATGCGKDKGGGGVANPNCAYGAYGPGGVPPYGAGVPPYGAGLPPHATPYGNPQMSPYGNPQIAYGNPQMRPPGAPYGAGGVPPYGAPGAQSYYGNNGYNPYGRPGVDASGCPYGAGYAGAPYGQGYGNYYGGYSPFDVNGLNSIDNNICSKFDNPEAGTYTRPVYFPGTDQVLCVEYSSFSQSASNYGYGSPMNVPGYTNMYQGCVPGMNVPANCQCSTLGGSIGFLGAGITAGVCF